MYHTMFVWYKGEAIWNFMKLEESFSPARLWGGGRRIDFSFYFQEFYKEFIGHWAEGSDAVVAVQPHADSLGEGKQASTTLDV